jgi:hypothetical protein
VGRGQGEGDEESDQSGTGSAQRVYPCGTEALVQIARPALPRFDFASVEAKLIIEVDGGQHDKRRAADGRRAEILESVGYLVLRFWNNDVLTNIDGVLEFIALTMSREALEPPHPARKGVPTSPQRGEG